MAVDTKSISAMRRSASDDRASLIEGEKTLLVVKSSCRTNRFQVEPRRFPDPGRSKR
jgi:hypothetical protein